MDVHGKDGSGSFSSLSASTGSTGGCRRARILEQSLNPMDGALKDRMNKTISHLATFPRTSKPYCHLHYWVTGERRYSNCAYCGNCNVVLCTDNCFEMFHSNWYLHTKKAELKSKMLKK